MTPWSALPPTRPGFYWFRMEGEIGLVLVGTDEHGKLWQYEAGGPTDRLDRLRSGEWQDVLPPLGITEQELEKLGK
jgi:hypothetical protein